ncbi:MAG TPA: ceramidase domain-containing protein [Fibrella sp.]
MKPRTTYTLLLRSIFLTLGMLVVCWGLDSSFSGAVWEGMVVSKSALTVEYCEFNHVDRFFHQPMNTYSNLAYFFFGVLILQIATADYKNQDLDRQNRMQAFPLLSALIGLCFIYLSFGSAFFHASLTYVGQRVDMNGTYGLTLVLVSIGLYQVLHRVNFSQSAKNVWIIALVIIILLFLKIALLIPSSRLLPSLILGQLVCITINYIQFRKQRSILLAIGSLVLLVLAVRFRTLDVQKIGCDPHSLVQGHSIWHLLTALSSFCSYSFFRFATPNSSRIDT